MKNDFQPVNLVTPSGGSFMGNKYLLEMLVKLWNVKTISKTIDINILKKNICPSKNTFD